jgi:hypothetical protein
MMHRGLPRWRLLRLLVVCGCTMLAAGAAHQARADITVGVFAPAAPLANTQARVDLGKRLADHFRELLSGQRVKSRVYRRAADFAAAVEKGQISVALVDTTYLRWSNLGHRVIAVAPDLRWHLVAARGRTMASLSKSRLLLAAGGHEIDVANGLLQGEAKTFFSSIDTAADSSASALAALTIRDQVDCVLLPEGLEMPSGVAEVKTLGTMPGLALVFYPAVLGEDLGKEIATAALSFRGPPPVARLDAAGDEVLVAVRQRLAVSPRKGPMVTLPLRVLIDGLVASPRQEIPERSALDFVWRPAASMAPRPTPQVGAAPMPPIAMEAGGGRHGGRHEP